MKIILIGLPGVGKSYWGQRLASHLNVPFFDLDLLIEQTEGKSISDVFAQQGESYFRKSEQMHMSKLLSDTRSMVVATGGGTPCYANSMSVMKKSGITVYLKDELKSIADRIRSEDGIRPLFASMGQNTEVVLRKMLDERKAFYEQSHIITDVSGLRNPHLFTKRLELFTGTT
ncbi:MAG: shikimate kinase [Flavobacteriales bacterium]|nr:shikimate kinase [Bacteroidota bacterium]MCB9241102.1 shikimate kinase [Flavobacteriales bacterium]